MRASDNSSGSLFSYVGAEMRVLQAAMQQIRR